MGLNNISFWFNQDSSSKGRKDQTVKLIAGVDEVGRGPLAGPVVAAVAVFEAGYQNSKFRDSKKLSAKTREILVPEIQSAAVAWAVVAVGARRIDQINILRASLLAMSLAVRKIRADLILVDGNKEIDTTLPQRAVVGGDDIHVEISAASILAKVYRDGLMMALDQKYPGYGFAKHAGYPTKQHRHAVSLLGPSRVHRLTFGGVREFINGPSKLVAND